MEISLRLLICDRYFLTFRKICAGNRRLRKGILGQPPLSYLLNDFRLPRKIANEPNFIVVLRILSSEYQIYACGKILRTSRI